MCCLLVYNPLHSSSIILTYMPLKLYKFVYVDHILLFSATSEPYCGPGNVSTQYLSGWYYAHFTDMESEVLSKLFNTM